jgi:hypothetical protein
MAGHSRSKNGVASLDQNRSKNGVASLAQSRSKNGVASLAYGPGHLRLNCTSTKNRRGWPGQARP